MRLFLKQWFALARLTMRDTMRQPICLILSVSCVSLIALLPAITMQTMGGADKLVRDGALALHFVGGLLLAGYAACAAVQHEIQRGTVATVLTKPVSREMFLLAKYAGVAALLLLFSLVAGVATLLSGRMVAETYRLDWWVGGPMIAAILLALTGGGLINYYRQRPFASAAFGLLVVLLPVVLGLTNFIGSDGHLHPYGANVPWQVVPVSLLVSMALLVLAGVAVSLATRLDTVPTLCICSVVFLLGLMSDYLFGRAAAHNWLAAIAYGLIPNWSHFWMTDALTEESTTGVPWVYVGQVARYAGFYLAGVLALGILAFRKMEVRA